MDRDTATQAATAWVRAHSDQQQDAQGVYPHVLAELMSLLPAEADADVVTVADRPAILAADTQGLWLVTEPTLTDGTFAQVVEYLPLRLVSKVTVLVSIAPEANALLRTRNWTFDSRDGQSLGFLTSERLQSAFVIEQRPSRGELVARQAARNAGWNVPDPDPGLDAYF
jgi:hypothetical protein